MPPLLGLDVSSVQGLVTLSDWVTIATRGTRFVVAKCGNGNERPDPIFPSNVEHAEAGGLVVGAYHFLFPALPSGPGLPTGRDPAEQARAHFAQCAGLGSGKGELTAFADLEWPRPEAWGKPLDGVVGRPTVTRQSVREWTLAYLVEYSRLQGRPMGLYADRWFLECLQPSAEFAAYPLWLAEYGPKVDPVGPWAGWSAWQTSGGGGRLPSGAPVDTDEIADEDTFAKLRGLAA